MKQSNDFRFKKLTDRREFFPDADGQIKPMIKDYFENGSFECKTEGRELRIYAKKKKETDFSFFISCKTRIGEDGTEYLTYALKLDRFNGVFWRVMTLIYTVFPWIFMYIVRDNPNISVGKMWIIYTAISVVSLFVFATSFPRKKDGFSLLDNFESQLKTLFPKVREIDTELTEKIKNITADDVTFKE